MLLILWVPDDNDDGDGDEGFAVHLIEKKSWFLSPYL